MIDSDHIGGIALIGYLQWVCLVVVWYTNIINFECPQGSILHVEDLKSCAICKSQFFIPSLPREVFYFPGRALCLSGNDLWSSSIRESALHEKGSCYRSGSSQKKGPRKPACLEHYNMFQSPILGELFQLFFSSSGQRPEFSQLSTFSRRDLTKCYKNIVFKFLELLSTISQSLSTARYLLLSKIDSS